MTQDIHKKEKLSCCFSREADAQDNKHFLYDIQMGKSERLVLSPFAAPYKLLNNFRKSIAFIPLLEVILQQLRD